MLPEIVMVYNQGVVRNDNFGKGLQPFKGSMLKRFDPRKDTMKLDQVYWKLMSNNRLSKRVCWFPDGSRYKREIIFIEL